MEKPTHNPPTKKSVAKKQPKNQIPHLKELNDPDKPKNCKRRNQYEIKNGSNDECVSQAIYGFCIDLNHDKALTDKERENVDWSDYDSVSDLFDSIEEGIKITENTKHFKYFVTDFEFTDDSEFGDSQVLIIGIPFNTLKAHYSGVMWCQPDVSSLDEHDILSFVNDNPRFKGVKPQVVTYTNMQK